MSSVRTDVASVGFASAVSAFGGPSIASAGSRYISPFAERPPVRRPSRRHRRSLRAVVVDAVHAGADAGHRRHDVSASQGSTVARIRSAGRLGTRGGACELVERCAYSAAAFACDAAAASDAPSSSRNAVSISAARNRGCSRIAQQERDVRAGRRESESRAARTTSRVARFVARRRRGDHFREHRIVMHRHLAAFVDARIDPNARPSSARDRGGAVRPAAGNPAPDPRRRCAPRSRGRAA